MEKFKKNVSVVITTHNRSESLRRAVASIKEQSVLPADIIVVDDYSDEQHVLANKSTCRDGVKYILLESNKGAQYARNIGVYESKGEIICFLDDDDVFSDNKVSKISEIFEKEPGIGAVSNAFSVFKDGSECQSIVNSEIKKVDHILKENLLGGCSVMSIRREEFDRQEGFCLDFKSCQDWDMWIRLFLNSKIRVIPDVLTKYNVGHKGRITKNHESVYLGRRKIFFKYRKIMSHKVREWHLFCLVCMRYNYYGHMKNPKLILYLLIRSGDYYKGFVTVGSMLKKKVHNALHIGGFQDVFRFLRVR